MPGRILIADDLASNRIVLKAQLSAAHYGLLLTDRRADAAALAASERPALVLLGLGEPVAEALAVCRKLKSDPVTAGIAVIALAARSDGHLHCDALVAGADAVLDRGCDERLLLARIRSLMRAQNHEAEFALRDATREALGFAETGPTYEAPGIVALVAHRRETALAWRATLAPRLRDRIEVIDAERLLDDTDSGARPDVYLIAADLAERHDGLRLIADLRSRARGRTAGIVAVVAPGDSDGAVSALDLGADDVVDDAADPMELVLRLRAQLRRKSRADRLRRQLSDGLQLAMTDPLTGLYNRRYALAQLARIAERAAATARPFAVMVLDLDRFKRVNDSFGHAVGDAVLVEAARRISGALRAVDLVARLGGEEFLVVMPDTGTEAARGAAERLRRIIEAAPFVAPEAPDPLRMTVSIGVAIGGALEDGPVDALMGLADRALYRAKADGRNQVTLGRHAA